MKVTFRKYPEGDVVAVFPEEPFNRSGTLLSSYQHVGQHGAADPKILEELLLATEEEYLPLYSELIQQGYRNLVIDRWMTVNGKIPQLKDSGAYLYETVTVLFALASGEVFAGKFVQEPADDDEPINDVRIQEFGRDGYTRELSEVAAWAWVPRRLKES